MWLLVQQLYCHNFRLLNLCSRVYKRSEHLSLSVQVEWDRVVEQFILLSNYTPLTFHMRAPLCFHTSSTNWLCLIRLGSICKTSTWHGRNSSARQHSQELRWRSVTELQPDSAELHTHGHQPHLTHFPHHSTPWTSEIHDLLESQMQN